MKTQEQQRISIIKKVLPAIVSISVFDRHAIKRTTHTAGIIAGTRLSRRQVDGGSGFIVDKSGIVTTNIHVIHNTSLRYTVTTSDQTTHAANVVGTDPVSDIAFLQISSPNPFPVVTLGDSSKLSLGQDVVAIGNMLGVFNNSISSGIISGLSRSITAHSKIMKECLHGLIQTDVAINPGSSGGPLLDSKGHVIGINAAIVSEAENISFAIPINAAKDDIARIKKFGTLQKPFLGVRYIMVTAENKKALHASTTGALIQAPFPYRKAVLQKSPAQRAGIHDDDIITHINGKRINSSNTLRHALETSGTNKKITLTIVRGNKNLTKTAFLTNGKL